MPRPPVKKTRKLAEAAEEGKLRAQLKMHKKKPLLESVKEHIGKALDRIDPLEAIAVLGTTFLIKSGINWAEDVAVKTIDQSILKTLLYADLNPFGGSFGETFLGKTPEQLKERLGSMDSEVIEWVLSFAMAYLIVKHFGDIVQAGSNVLGIAKGLLGIGVATV